MSSMNLFGGNTKKQDLLYHFTTISNMCRILCTGYMKGNSHYVYPYTGNKAEQVFFTDDADLINRGIPLREGLECGLIISKSHLKDIFEVREHVDTNLQQYVPDLNEKAFSVRASIIPIYSGMLVGVIIKNQSLRRLKYDYISLKIIELLISGVTCTEQDIVMIEEALDETEQSPDGLITYLENMNISVNII